MKNGRHIVRIRARTLKSALARGGKTYKWLAGKIGVRPEYVSALVRGVRNPGPKLRYKIHATIFKIAMMSWHDLFVETRR